MLTMVGGLAFGQVSAELSSGSAAPGGTAALTLSIATQGGNSPAALQWTLTYSPGNVASIAAAPGANATAAGKTITCAASSGALTCLLGGANDNTMQDGIVAAITVVMTPSASSTTVGVTNVAAATPAGGPLTAAGIGGTITIPSAYLSGLSCSPSFLSTGGSTTCTATLNQAAPAGGASVALTSSTGELFVPTPLTVPAGMTSASFVATAGTIPVNLTAGITGTLNGISLTAYVSLLAPTTVSQLSCAPASLGVGGSSICTVTLSRAANLGGVTVLLSSNALALTVPPSVSVASGTVSANFAASAGTFTATQTAVVTAFYNNSSQTAPILLATSTAVSLLSCSPSNIGSGGISTCTVALSQAAGSGGATVTLSSSTPTLTVPPAVNVPGGATNAAFTAVAGSIPSNQTAVVTASYNSTAQTASISLQAATAVSLLSCSPATLNSGSVTNCTVTLTQAAGSGGATITLASDTILLTVPPSVSVAAGAISAGFNGVAGALTSSLTADVTASFNGSSQTTSVSLVAPGELSQLTCTPTILNSGGTASCTVTLSSAAPAGGATVLLSSSAAVLTVPDSAAVAAGAISASFTATAGSVTGSQSVTVTASWNGVSQIALFNLQVAQTNSSSMVCNPDQNNAGTLDCTVSLPQAAPPGGATVTLQANTSRVQVPAQVLVPAGAQSAQFTATVLSSDQDAQAQITAAVQGSLATANVAIIGIRPTGLLCAPQTVPAGTSLSCTATLNTPNVLQIARLAVSSDNSSLALPATFATRPGQAHVSFQVFTSPLEKLQTSTVAVQFGQTAVSAPVTITPATAPVLSLPGAQLTAFGKPLTFTFSAVDPSGLPLLLTAANLPQGASFNATSGIFSWTPAASAFPAALGQPAPLQRRQVTFTATDSAQASASGTVVLEADAGLPLITDLRNAASQEPQNIPPKVKVPSQPVLPRCTPGSLASLIGRWLTTATDPQADPTGASLQLGGTAVTVNGNPAPVVYAAPDRIDFLCPDAIAGGQLEISAQSDGTPANLLRANQQATLGLFAADASGQGQGMITLAGTSLLATPRSYLNQGQPAEPGDAISLLATGIGLATSPSLVKVSIGSTSTTATQVQAVPGSAGVYQITVTVPSGVVPGNTIPVSVEIADGSGTPLRSNTVTIAIEAARY